MLSFCQPSQRGGKTAKIEKMKQLADSKPKSIPRAIALADGDVKHYADADSNIAIARTGDTFLVYDYNTGNVTRDMTRAEANGISEADALSYARVSARTGLDIVFDKKACYKGKNEAGADVYHAGFYDPENNRIVDKVVTIFGKEGLRSYLQKEIQKGNLVRIKKEKPSSR